jgi:hypothetical protein
MKLNEVAYQNASGIVPFKVLEDYKRNALVQQ